MCLVAANVVLISDKRNVEIMKANVAVSDTVCTVCYRVVAYEIHST